MVMPTNVLTRKVVLTVVLGLCVRMGTLSSASAAPGDINAYCQRIGRGSYQSELFCIEQENKVYEEMSRRRAVEQRILDYCNRVANSWQSYKFCIDQEEQAKARLGR